MDESSQHSPGLGPNRRHIPSSLSTHTRHMLSSSSLTQVDRPTELRSQNYDEMTDGLSPSNQQEHLGKSGRVSAKYNPVATDEEDTPRAEYPRRTVEISTILADFAAIAIPSALIGFVVLLWLRDGSEVTESAYISWEDAITIVATVFPILFASIVGRLMSEAARLKLERGATVGSLEQLMGSRTVGGTVLTLFSFRSFNILSASLVILWALSPLGTQSVLRLMESRLEPRLNDIGITYFDNSASSEFATEHWNRIGSWVMASQFRSVALLYTALVATPEDTKADSIDLWGNVKIPFLNHTESHWKELPREFGIDGYSSLAGIPLSQIGSGNTTFTMESSYISLACTNLTNINEREITDEDQRNDLIHSETLSKVARGAIARDEIFHLPNGTWHGYSTNRVNTSVSGEDPPTTWSLALDRFVSPLWTGMNNTKFLGEDDRLDERDRPVLFRNETGIEVGPTTLMFQAIFKPTVTAPLGLLRAYCGVTQKYVESRVTCSRAAAGGLDTRQSCRVVAQRPSQQQHASEEISYLMFPGVFNMISEQFPLTIGGAMNYLSDFSLYHLQDPALGGLVSDDEYFLKGITAEALGRRLSQLLNTYFTLTQLPRRIIGGSTDNMVSETNLTVPAEISNLVLMVDISGLWAAACLVSTIILLGADVLGVVCKHWAKGPEVLGYASTVFRDSKYVDLPVKAGQLDCVELSRGMKSQRLRYGVTRLIKDGEPLVGVGYQQDTETIKYIRR